MMIDLVILATILVLAMIFGTIIERRHYRQIQRREEAMRQLPCSTFTHVPPGRTVQKVTLARGSVVLASDRFKIFLAGLVQLFGGELKTHASVIDRARREAVLRMKESCPWADCFVNLRIETSNMSNRNTLASIHAYATAIKFANHPEG